MQKKIDEEYCYNYLSEHIFKLRPKSYGDKYPNWPGAVGIELEMLPTTEENIETPLSVPLHGERSISASILAFAEHEPWEKKFESGKQGEQILSRLLLENGTNISFEPGGQVEISTQPYPCLSDAVLGIENLQDTLEDVFKKQGWRLSQIGINPWHTVEQIGLQMNKQRYLAMDEYFTRISEYGRRMMRQTCTVQVCLDFGPSEETMAKRFFAAQLLSPFAAATFAYSNYVDGAFVEENCFRQKVWQNLDHSRTGVHFNFGKNRKFAKMHFDKEACIDSYLQFALHGKLPYVGNQYMVPEKDLTFMEWMKDGYQGLYPNEKDFETHLSLLFPEVRPRGFLEIRSIDCQDRYWQIIPAAYYTGLLYDEYYLDRVLDLLIPYKDRLSESFEKGCFGLKDEKIRSVSQSIMELSLDGFSKLPSCFRGAKSGKKFYQFAEHFTFQGRTPADDLRDWALDKNQGKLNISTLEELGKHWRNM